MIEFQWDKRSQARLNEIKTNLASISTASACQLLISLGWRNTYMLGIRPLQALGLGTRIVGRARTCRYLMRREAEAPIDAETRRSSPEIQLIESIDEGDIFCVDALGLQTAGIIGDILATRLKFQGAAAAIIFGAVRDGPYLREVGLPVFSFAEHPAHSGRDLIAVEYDRPVNMAGVHVLPGDIILADDEGAIAMPLHLAEYIAEHG